MPLTFIFAIVVAILALLCGGGALAMSRMAKASAGRQPGRNEADPRPVRTVFRVLAVAFGGLALLLTLVSSWNPVGTQDIGIVTSFGQPVGHLGPGANWTAPWDQVTSMDEAIQVTDYAGPDCLTVRIADQQTACVVAKVRWRIQGSDSDNLFRNYKNSTAGVENGLLTPELENTANQVFDGYDPVGLLNSPVAPGRPGNPTVPQLGQEVQQQLAAKIGSEVQIVSLFMPNIIFDSTVQARLNAVLTQKADTLVAQQAEQTATDQAAANKALSASVSNDPNVLVSRCLDILSQMVKQSMAPPAGFSCFGGSGIGVIAK